MGAESIGIWFMVAAIAFVVMCMLLVVVGLILLACFNTMRNMRKEAKIYAKAAYHHATMNEFLVRVLSRFERNLAQWYNDATGRGWEINQRDRNVYENLKKEVQVLKDTLEEERRRFS